MTETLFFLDPDHPLGLQGQIRQQLVQAILLGTLPANSRLPSSRKLADQLGVARNTVVLAYQQLVDEGYLESRERSGVYVNPRILDVQVAFRGTPSEAAAGNLDWHQRLQIQTADPGVFEWPSDWQQHPYPFIDGYYDDSLYPVTQWREASKLALGGGLLRQGTASEGSADDPQLIEEIRTRVLPRRGINARPEEILVTIGEQNALYLLSRLLVAPGARVAIEEPGNPRMRRLLAHAGAELHAQPVDEDGMLVDERLDDCTLAYVTPSHQHPTAVTMPNARRRDLLARAGKHDLLIIEDDQQGEQNYVGQPHPALRGMDRDGHVVYVSALPRVLAPGLRLGYIVAAPELIREARSLRQLMIGRPSIIEQRTAAMFLSLGHYDAVMMRAGQVFNRRWNVLRDALNHYFRSAVVTIPNQGGTAFWVRGPEHLEVDYLVQEAAKAGVLIEPASRYWAGEPEHPSSFRMGVTSIPHERIRDGVEQLAAVIRRLSRGEIERLGSNGLEPLDEAGLKDLMPGATLLCKTVYGAPCTIELAPDGRMHGRAGHADEERDRGRWWIDGDRWFRQWDDWAFGEELGFRVCMQGRQLKLFNDDGRLVDTLIHTPSG